MDSFEEIITKQRDKIQDDCPHQGHMERFELKLQHHKQLKRKQMILFISSVAAILIIAISVYIRPQNETQPIRLSDISQNYSEVEFYYTSSINKQTRKLSKLSKQIEPNRSLNLMIEEAQKYDTAYDQLCKDLEATPHDQRVINAFMIYYQTKLEVINKILNEIENEQIKQDENIRI